MAQQQLFTLVLVVIVVGFAIIRGITMFSEEHLAAHEQQMRENMLTAAERAQIWYRRPAQLGGCGRSFAQVSWSKINMPQNTPIATFTMSNKLPNRFLLTGISKEDTSLIMKYLVYADSLVLQP